MPIPVVCSCGSRFTAPEKYAGRQMVCPKCHATIQIPQPNQVLVQGIPQAKSPNDTAGAHSQKRPVVIDPAALPKSLPPDFTGWEVAFAADDIRRFETLDPICTGLLAGAINRYTFARYVAPKPEKTIGVSQDFYDVFLAEWKSAQIWQPIGIGLWKRHGQIRLLYDPVGEYGRTAGQIGWAAVFLATLLALIYFWVMAQHPQSTPYISTPGFVTGQGVLLVLAFKAMVSMAIAGVVGFLGYAIGYPIGRRIGTLRGSSTPKPPDDGFKPPAVL